MMELARSTRVCPRARSPLPALPPYADYAVWRAPSSRRAALRGSPRGERGGRGSGPPISPGTPASGVPSSAGARQPIGDPAASPGRCRAGPKDGRRLHGAVRGPQLLLHRYTGQGLGVGTRWRAQAGPRSSRWSAAFVNTLVLRADLSGGRAFASSWPVRRDALGRSLTMTCRSSVWSTRRGPARAENPRAGPVCCSPTRPSRAPRSRGAPRWPGDEPSVHAVLARVRETAGAARRVRVQHDCSRRPGGRCRPSRRGSRRRWPIRTGRWTSCHVGDAERPPVVVE